MTSRYLAIDLGAESGRVMLGTLESGRISLKELIRFSNKPIRDGDGLYWDIKSLLDGVRDGLVRAGALGESITSVSADAWGVDYVLIDDAGQIMEPVFHYRHPRTVDGEKKALSKVDWPTLFDESGVQYMILNTSIQLSSEESNRLFEAKTILTIADAFNYLLSGVAKIEVSMASTTQLYNPRMACWSDRLISSLGFPKSIFPEVVSPVSGRAPNKYSFLQRLYNAYSPLKIHPAMTKEEKFLYDIEYDVSSAFKKRQGVNLLAEERNALNAEMGKQGYFRQEVARIMKTAEARNTINELKTLRRPPNFVGSQDTPIGQYDQIHMMLRDAQKEAEKRAYNTLTPEMKAAIDQRIRVKNINATRAQQGLGPIPTNRY